MELSLEELRGNICLRCGKVTQDIPTTNNGCGNKFMIENAISCPKGGLVMAPHDEVAEEWVALGDRSLIPSAIFYKPKINSRTVQGGRTRYG